jgi:hypothetical protein
MFGEERSMSVIKVETTVDVDMNDVWEKIWGSDGTGFVYWCDMVRDTDGGDFDAWNITRSEDGKFSNFDPNPHDFKVHDRETDEWHEVTLSQLAYAWVNMKQDGVTHCGGYSLDDDDACVGDLVLQYTIFGEIVYG